MLLKYQRSILLFAVAAATAVAMTTPAASQRRPRPSRCVTQPIFVKANEFADSDNVAPASGEAAIYGEGVILNAPPYSARPNAALYYVYSKCEAQYVLSGEYAAAERRPVQVHVNGTMVISVALDAVTGGWTPEFQKWKRMGSVHLQAGKNSLLIRSGAVFPHIRSFKFHPIL